MIKKQTKYHPPIKLVDNTLADGHTLLPEDLAIMERYMTDEKLLAEKRKAQEDALKKLRDEYYNDPEATHLQIQKRLRDSGN